MTHQGRAALLAFLILSLMIPGVVAPLSASAQGAAPVIEQAELRLWPEYDDPGLLVILSGNFASGVTYPVQLSIPMPAGARNIQATYQDAAGTLLTRPFEVKDGKLTYEVPSGSFHIEYYLDRAPSGNQRQIDFAFDAPYAINALRVAAQQPARSSEFALTPAAAGTEQGTDGLTYHVLTRNNVAAGEKLDIGINYTKTDTSLSAPQLAVTSTGAAPQAAPAPAAATSSSVMDWLPWVLIGVGVVLAVGILAYWLLSRRQPAQAASAPVAAARPARTPQQAAARPAQKPLPTVPARPPAGPAAFCHNCGSALKPEDRFCAQCGTPRRS
jgi:hypothetical protein